MTHIPRIIIVVDDADHKISKAKFLEWSSGLYLDQVKFITINEATKMGIDLAKINPENQINDIAFSEQTKKVVLKLKAFIRPQMKRKSTLKVGRQQHKKGSLRSIKRAKTGKLRYK